MTSTNKHDELWTEAYVRGATATPLLPPTWYKCAEELKRGNPKEDPALLERSLDLDAAGPRKRGSDLRKHALAKL